LDLLCKMQALGLCYVYKNICRISFHFVNNITDQMIVYRKTKYLSVVRLIFFT
ncbi:hypothetical protein L9F63_003008, partial [Diploptera punctata]